MRAETCDECRFDSTRWDAADTISTLRSLAARWDQVLDGLPPALADVRPDDETWSIAEYTDHAANTLWSMRFVLEVIRADPGSVLDSGAGHGGITPDHRPVDLAEASARMHVEGAALHDLACAIPPDTWEGGAVTIDGEAWSIGWTLRHTVHDVSHHLVDIGRIRHRLGDGVPHQVGRIEQISVSAGGVPKLPVERAAVGWAGLAGDRQADRGHHGRPWQALCLWSTEVIAALQAEGHPINAGVTGENVTVSGLDWATLRPGTRLRIGGVTAEVSAYAIPCAKNGRWFAGGDFGRMHFLAHPGWSRLYASVLEPGEIATGDLIEVEPTA